MKKLKMLAIDLGASSGRGIIGSFDGNKIELAENHRFLNEPVMAAGQFTWDILRIYHEIKNSLRACALGEDKDIASIGIDTWGVDFGFLDKKGRLMGNPVHYRDERNNGMPEYAFGIVPRDEVYGKTGIQIVDFNTLYQLLAVKKDTPEILEAAESMLFVPDLLNYFLTGVKQTEYTIASTGQLLDAEKRDWAWELIDKFGLPRRLFSDIVMPSTVIGGLRREVLDEVGALNAKVISVAAHDTGSAVMSVPAKSDKFIWTSSGTWSIMGTETKEPVISDKTSLFNFTNEGGAERTIRLSKNITGLWIEQESKRQWEREGEKLGYAELTKLSDEATPFKCFINPDDERFSTPGNMPKRIQDYCRETNQPIPETKGEIVRCITESLAMKYRTTAEMTDELCSERMPSINIVGGGTQKNALNQYTANACNRPVFAGPVEATALGNIISQAIAAGEIKDLKEGREVIANSFEIKEYQPKDTAAWDAAYETYLKVTNQK